MENRKPSYTLPQASVEDFYQHVQRSFEGNNYVYKIEAIMDDGTGPLRIVFESPKKFTADKGSGSES